MAKTEKRPRSTRDRNLRIGLVLFVLGIAVTNYCGYMERYEGVATSGWLKLLGWGLLFVGLVLFVLGIVQAPIRRD